MLRRLLLASTLTLLGAAPLAAQSDSPPGFMPDRTPRTFASTPLPDAVAARTIEETRLTASSVLAGDLFGRAVAVDGDRVLVGAWGDDDLGPDSGSAYVYEFDGSAWVLQATLAASDGVADDYFGFTLALDGDRALVSSVGDDDNGSNSGSVYVLVYDGTDWVEEAKLVASDGEAIDRFGSSLALDGDRALVGASRSGDAGPFTGSAYVFTFDGTVWTEQAKLTASDAARDSEFGSAVALDGDYAFVAAHVDDAQGTNAGAVYAFAFDGAVWAEQAKLTAADTVTEDYFGESVSLDGDRALIGAWYDTELGFDAGSVYVFERDGETWQETAKLLASDGQSPDQFGGSVSLDGDRALIGARLHSAGAPETGAAYLFSYDGTAWEQQAKLVASDANAFDSFGRIVSLSGETALVGAPLNGDAGTLAGAAYLFDAISTSSVDGPAPARHAVQARPNPAAGQAALTLTLAEAGPARLSLHDVLGRELAVMAHGPHRAGEHTLALDAARLSPGVYVIRLQTEDGVQTTRLTVAR